MVNTIAEKKKRLQEIEQNSISERDAFKMLATITFDTLSLYQVQIAKK